MSETEEVSIKVWIQDGTMLVNAYALEPEHPEHPYNQLLTMGKIPENYGVFHPYAEEFASHTRGELINEIVSLRKELEAYHRYVS